MGLGHYQKVRLSYKFINGGGSLSRGVRMGVIKSTDFLRREKRRNQRQWRGNRISGTFLGGQGGGRRDTFAGKYMDMLWEGSGVQTCSRAWSVRI